VTSLALPQPGIYVPSPKEIWDSIRGGLSLEGLKATSVSKPQGPTIDLMAGFADATELLVLDSIFGDGSTNLFTAPTYLALTTVAVGETDTAGSITEANYTGYARKSIAAADMSAAAAGSKTNGNALTFANCTAGSSTVIGWGVVSSSSGAGTLIVFGTCTSTVISTTQTPPNVAAGALVVNLD